MTVPTRLQPRTDFGTRLIARAIPVVFGKVWKSLEKFEKVRIAIASLLSGELKFSWSDAAMSKAKCSN